MRSVFVKSLHDQRRALAGFGLGTILMVLLETAIWPSISSIPSLDSFLAGYPEAMRRMFDLEEFGTGTGFVNAELFSALVPVLFLAFAIARGSRSIAGEEASGTLDVLLVTRVTTTRLVVEQAAALLVSLLALGGVLYLAVLGGSAVFGMGIGAADLLAATLASVGLAVEFGWLALAVGAVTGRRGISIGVATAAAVAAYLLYVAGELVEAIEPWQPLSPFDQALSGGPIGAGFQLAHLAMPLTGAVLLALALPVFAHRDIAVAQPGGSS
jgi:ABC-2 type transport system permease protein